MTKQEQILQLKQEKDAVILAHYYVQPEIQEVADYIGDSFALSKKAVGLSNKVIVFCGVSFMGESAKLLNPDKEVLMPELSADCPMAHMVTKETVDAVRAAHPDAAVVCYINSTAEIKAWSDVCVTSANALKIVKALPNQHILFIPDRNLAHYLAEQLPEKKFIFNDGFCPIHEHMSAAEIRDLKEQHPEAKVLVHPECRKAVLDEADFIGSTSGIIDYAKASPAKEFVIGTEIGVLYALQQARPDASFYFPATEPVCADMKKITLDQIIDVLKTGKNSMAQMDEHLAVPAKKTLTRMLELAK